jgi:hypothetical protein
MTPFEYFHPFLSTISFKQTAIFTYKGSVQRDVIGAGLGFKNRY